MVLGGQPGGFLGVVSGTNLGADFSTFTPAPYVLRVIQKAAREGHWVTPDIPAYEYGMQ